MSKARCKRRAKRNVYLSADDIRKHYANCLEALIRGAKVKFGDEFTSEMEAQLRERMA